MKNLRFSAAFAALLLMAALGRGTAGQAAPKAEKFAGAPQLVIVDTDIGDDLDDAFALGLVLSSPELRLLGVTTEFADTELRARLVDRYLAAVGRGEVPVAAGAPEPGPAPSNFTQAAYARQAPERKHGDGAAFLLDQIRAHPGEITLIAIGPLFNVDAAIEREPATFRKLKRVVLMGGSVYRGYDDSKTGDTHRPPNPEWNIRCDPAGSRALLGSGVPIFMMPLDSTQIHPGMRALAALFSHGSALTDQLTLLYHQWSGVQEWRTPTLFDPVAVAYAIRPELCPARPMRLEVDDTGMTLPVEGAPNVQVCLQSDEKGFLEFMLGRMKGETERHGSEK